MRRKKRKHGREGTPRADDSAAALFPTRHKYHGSVVQIYVDSFQTDYDAPWKDNSRGRHSGSGFVIERDGKKYIVTNAHVAENQVRIRIRSDNDRSKKVKATVKQIAYQSDLALLEISDKAFEATLVPGKLGDMVSLTDDIVVVGFPMGGDEVSLSEGTVSRIQVDRYSMSDQHFLQVQVSAAINPGNSGGPVFDSAGNIIGVAFQGYGLQGLSYIIPMPIVNHFLNEVFSGKPYRGYPSIPWVIQSIENKYERKYYGMGSHTGVRIKSIDLLTDASSKIKANDILVAIDGMPVSNEGTVDIPGIGKCIDLVHVTQMGFIGDEVELTIIRKDKDTQAVHKLKTSVTLDAIYGDTEKVPDMEHDKKPTFYSNSGFCFMPLTLNYMEAGGSIFEEMHVLEHNCRIGDIPKKNPDDQIVVINSIFVSSATHGYDDYLNSIVKEINGVEINNIKDVIKAMEGNDTEEHIISVGKSTIVLPNMSDEKMIKILRKNDISHMYSRDLAPFSRIDYLAIMARLNQEAEARQVAARTARAVEDTSTAESATDLAAAAAAAAAAAKKKSSTCLLFQQPLQQPRANAKTKAGPHGENPTTKRRRRRKAKAVIDSSSSSEEEDAAVPTRGGVPASLTRDNMPGLSRYRRHLDTMEARAQRGLYQRLSDDDGKDQYLPTDEDEYDSEAESDTDDRLGSGSFDF